MKELIKKLTETYGPSGNEEAIRKLIQKEIESYVDRVAIDKLGNLIAIKGGEGAKVMLAAHMDEIGVIVTYIDKNGFLRFAPVGTVYANRLLGQRIIFSTGLVGTFGAEKMEPKEELKIEKMFIDIGAQDKEEAEKMVKIGDVACFEGSFVDLGGRIIAKALDDRLGCALLIELLKRVKRSENEVHFVFTVQEEVGVRGATTSAYGIYPDMAIAVDVTATGDTPEAPTMAISLGKGPAIKVKDRLLLAHPKVKKILVDAALESGIPYQLEILEQGGTDAGAIHITREGVPTGVVSIPCRYIHTPSEMADYGDIKNALELLSKVLEKPLKI